MIKSWSFDTHLESLSIYRRVDTFLRSKEGLSLCFGEMFGQKFPIHYQLANRSFGFVGSRGHGTSQGSTWGWIALVGRHGGLKSVSEDDCGMGGKRSFLWRIFMCLRRPEKSRKDFHWTKKMRVSHRRGLVQVRPWWLHCEKFPWLCGARKA